MMRIALALAFLCTAVPAVQAQTSRPPIKENRFHRVFLRNGNVVDGQLIRFTRTGVLLQVKFGEFEIRGDLIEKTAEGKLNVVLVKVRSIGQDNRVEEQPDEPLPPEPGADARRDPFQPPPITPSPDDPTVVSLEMRERVDKLLDKMLSGNEDQRVDIIQELMALGEDAAIYIAGRLDQIPEQIRSEAAEVLSGIESPKAMPALVNLLKHEDAGIRTQALNAIGGMQNPSNARYLRPLLTDQDAIVRGAAVLMLERLDDISSFDAISGLTTDNEKAVRTQAITSLFNMAKKHEEEGRLLSAFRSRIRRAKGESRADIISGIGRLQIRESWRDIAPFLRDPSPFVRQSTAVALSRLNSPEAGEDITARIEVERDKWTRMYLINCIRKYKLRDAVDPLIELLRANDKDLQKASGETLKLLTGEGLAPEYDLWSEWRDKSR